MIGKAILGGSLLGLTLAKLAEELPGMTMVERYGVLGLLAWMVVWQARRAVAAQDATAALVRDCIMEQKNLGAAVGKTADSVSELARRVERFCEEQTQAHQDILGELKRKGDTT